MSTEANNEYETCLKEQIVSGPHKITAEMKTKNRAVKDILERGGCFPIKDVYKKSDCDLIYRFLIARKFNVDEAADFIKKYVTWREETGCDDILSEIVHDKGDMPSFCGRDKDGFPIMCNKPDPKALAQLLSTMDKKELLRRHVVVMERGRYLCKKHNVDRISCIFDLSGVTLKNITSAAIGFLKEMSHLDQERYPENMRRMIVCNGGWAVTSGWKALKIVLDTRVQEKISFQSGPPSCEGLAAFVDRDQMPREYGGGGGDVEDFESQMSRPWGTKKERKPSLSIKAPVGTAEGGSRQVQLSKGTGREESCDSDGFYSVDSDVETEGSDNEINYKTQLAPGGVQNGQTLRPSSPLSPKKEGLNPENVFNLLDEPSRREKPFSCIFSRSDAGGLVAFANTSREEGKLVGIEIALRANTTVIESGSRKLIAEVIKESGHPVHVYVLLVDDANNVRFALKKRRLRDQIDICVVRGDCRLKTDAKMKHRCDGEKVHIMTVSQWECSKDRRDWAIWRKNKSGTLAHVNGERASPMMKQSPSQGGKTYLAEKSGSVVTIEGELLNAAGSRIAVALMMSIIDLWHFN